MDYFPFPLTRNENELYQKHSLITPDNILTQGHLEKLISKLSNYPYQISSYGQIQGIIGEFIGRELFEYHMDKLLSEKFKKHCGKLIQADKDYIIKKSDEYIAKIQNKEQVVILEEEKNELESSYAHFGFKNIAEIDGLYFVKKQKHNKKNEKGLIALEIKTGENDVSAKKIEERIIGPLSDLYKEPVGYVLMGFADELYSKEYQKNNLPQLNSKIATIQEQLSSKNIPFSCIHFPFTKERFMPFVRKIENRHKNQFHGSAIYDKTKEKVTITDSYGNIVTLDVMPT